MAETYMLTFPGATAASGNQFAGSLQTALREEAGRAATVQRLKEDPDTQDAGAILQIVLTSAAVSSVASGIATWLARNSGATIDVSLPDGTHVAVKHSGENTADTVKAIFNRS